jgi:hypothetical protein
MKMYIFIKDTVPEHMVPVCCAHASLGCYLKYPDSEEMKQWISGPFKKVICKVNQKNFDKLKLIDDMDFIVQRENNLNDEVCIAFVPKENWPKKFYSFPLWKPEWTKEKLANILFCYEDVNIEQQINILAEKANAFDLLHFERPEYAEEIYFKANNRIYVDTDKIEIENDLSHLGNANDNQ